MRIGLAVLAGALGLPVMNSVLSVSIDLWLEYAHPVLGSGRTLAYLWVAGAAAAAIGGLVAVMLGFLLAASLGRNRVQLSIPLLLGFNLTVVAGSIAAQPDSVPALLASFYTIPVFWTFQLGCVAGIWFAGRPRSRVV
jgi:hypothetical protein